MNRKDAMTARTVSVEFMLSYSTIILAFKEHLKGFFFVLGRFFGEAFDNNVAFGVFLNVHLVLIIFVEKITESLVVEFEVGNRDLNLVFVPGVDFLIKLGNQARDETSVLVITLSASHSECLTCPSLSVAENTSRVPVQCAGEDLLGAEVVNDLLGAVHEDFFELESPLVLGVIDDALIEWFLNVNVDRSKLSQVITLFVSQYSVADGRSWKWVSFL